MFFIKLDMAQLTQYWNTKTSWCVCLCVLFTNIFAYRFLYLYSLRHHQAAGRPSGSWHRLTPGPLEVQARGAGMSPAAGWPSRSICRPLFCLHLSTFCWSPPRWPAACQAPNPMRSCPSFCTWNTTFTKHFKSPSRSLTHNKGHFFLIDVNMVRKEKAFMINNNFTDTSKR